MTDDFLDRDDAAIDASSFLDWLDEMARSEGKSREEILETLVSSYWTLDEMFRLMEGADPDSDLSIPLDSADADTDERDPADRIEDLESTLSDRIDDIDARFRHLREGDVERASQPSGDELVESVEELRGRVEELERSLAEGEDVSASFERELEGLAEQLRTVRASLSSRQEALEDRIDDEFGHLRTILEHLIDATDDVDGRTARLEDRYDHELRLLQANIDRLIELKRTAARLGIGTAVCEYCDEKVDLALLPTPHCPQCDRTFLDVEPKQGWFGSPKLTVTDEPLVEEPSAPGPRQEPDDGEGAADAPGETSEGFDWTSRND